VIGLIPPCPYCRCRWTGDYGWPHICKETIHGTPVAPVLLIPMGGEPEDETGKEIGAGWLTWGTVPGLNMTRPPRK